MTLATTIGLLLLLASPRTLGVPASRFLFQTQENSPAQTPSDQTPSQNKTKPAPPDKTEPPAPQPPSSSTGSTDVATEPAPTSTKPKPATPNKATAKPARISGKKHAHPKANNVVVVRNGGTSDSQGQISSGTTDHQSPEQLKKTNSLLSATASNLQALSGKELNPSQQDMVKQIRNYMQQSKNATAAGDVQGANNLAFKAHLLSEELVKH